MTMYVLLGHIGGEYEGEYLVCGIYTSLEEAKKAWETRPVEEYGYDGMMIQKHKIGAPARTVYQNVVEDDNDAIVCFE